jgi:hypothetical protein
MNRQSRRRAFGSVTAVATIGALALAGCAKEAASLGTAAAQAAMGAIIARVQAGVTALGTFATALGANLSTDAQAAIARAVAAAQSIGATIANGAVAVANAVTKPLTGPGIASLLQTAADVVIPLLQMVPGLGNLVSVAIDVKAIIPTIVAFAASIVNPATVSAPANDNGAARRLGIVA